MNASRSIWLGLLAPRAFYKRRRNRIAFVAALLSLLCCSAAQGYAAENLECPEIGSGRVPVSRKHEGALEQLRMQRHRGVWSLLSQGARQSEIRVAGRTYRHFRSGRYVVG